MLHTILFDLDGTLTDPGEGITNSVAHALRRFGFPEEERSNLYKFIGPPLNDSFMKYYGLSPEDAMLGIQYYREYFTDRGIFENIVYDGVPEMLAELRGLGFRTVVATSKPEEFALRILDHFDLTKYFDITAGATMDEKINKKADVVRMALERAGVTDPSEALMVGDREHDVLGARENGLDTVGVLYGYGSRDELEAAGAKYLIEKPGDLPALANAVRRS